MAFGDPLGRIVLVPLGIVRIISARKATRPEKTAHEEITQ
jgi:hypothetical protein